MRVRELSIKGIGRLHEQTGIPTDKLNGAGIVAVRGLNGAGKTTLIECIPGLVYGSVPSHGLLSAMANANDSFVEAVIETDQAYRLRRVINATLKTPKVEAYLFDSAGNPLNDGKQTTFAAEVARRFPSEKVYMASGFAAQKRGGQFLEVSKVERKELFAEMLGLGDLQRLSEAAAARASSIESEVAILKAKCEAYEEKAEHVIDLTNATKIVRDGLADIVRELGDLETMVQQGEALALEWRAEADSLSSCLVDKLNASKDADTAVRMRRGTLVSIQRDIASTEGRRDNIRSALDDGDGLTEIVGGIGAIQDALEQARADITEANSTRVAHEEAGEVLRRMTDVLGQAERQAERDLKSTHGLSDVPCGGDGEFSSCPLISRAVQARDKGDKNAKAVEQARLAVDNQREAIIRLPGIVQADTEKYNQLQADLSEAKTAEVRLNQLVQQGRELAKLDMEAAELGTRMDQTVSEIGEMEAVLASAEDERKSAKDLVDGHEAVKPESPDRAGIAELQNNERHEIAQLARLESQLSEACEARDKVAGMQDEIYVAQGDSDDWKHLGKALGRDGVQALEVDAAGPEVSDLINELLHSCYGARFTCSLQTTALKRNGKGTKEVFDLQVIDTEMGTDGSASDLSGGERVIVAEALGLAIAIYNARQSSVPILDLFRDECAGALDFQNAPRYVAMLRRALELGGFHRVYFIAHQCELWDLADAQLVVTDGVAEVQ